ncbi:hydrogenase/urease maturation nickel metallochaperone HypA [Methanococcoides methylutens]|uniref:Hydrogenase maturation factor HypA n=1 Tax=Methanococcoides methylutens MM1 TaxID=1434104 RepID=A0A0E3X0K1_METMT|nr:hydrogenase/urease maturation nickel metallochaperone HypA [Methanococcoides methylutens]AKB85390.1 [NiFe] hydrogenase nickel incorporation protein HypA [Methanococcoides methylutens MM1]
MHEYSLACEIFETVIETAHDNKASAVNSITLEIGMLTHANPEQLLFCLEVLSRDSIAEGAKVNVNFISPYGECDCGYRGDVGVGDGINCEDQPSLYEYAVMTCPSCGKPLQLVGGDELIVQTIDIEI